MTPAEQMVWAAAFVGALSSRLRDPPSRVLVPGKVKDWAQWEGEQAVSACEIAAGAVMHLRAVGEDVRAGFGVRSDVYEMWAEMVGKREDGR